MHRRLRVDVLEHHHLLVLVHPVGRYRAASDFTENAVVHRPFSLRAAFSSRPDNPKRRSSSNRTSAGLSPCWSSSTSVWNQRSAVSWTICLGAPPLAAIPVS